jgi:hypothetical protein
VNWKSSANSSGKLYYSQASPIEDSDTEDKEYIVVEEDDGVPLPRRSARIRQQELCCQVRPLKIRLGRVLDEHIQRMGSNTRTNARWCRAYKRRQLTRGGDPLRRMRQARLR